MNIKKIVRTLEQGIRHAEEILIFIGIGMLTALMFLGSADVIGRYVFNRPISGAMEWSQILMAGLTLLGLGYAQAKGAHIRVDFFVIRYSPRIKLVVEIAILILTLVFFAFILWQSAMIAFQDLRENRIVETICFPLFPVKLLVPLGSLVVCLECITQLVHLLHGLFKRTR